MFYLLCRICCMLRIGLILPFQPLCALRQVSHSPESGRLISSFSPSGIFFPARAQRPSRALFLVWATVYYLFAQNQAFKLCRIHSTFVHYVSKRLSTLFPTLERGVPPRLSPHPKKGAGQPSLPRALFPFCAKNGPLIPQRPALRLFTFRSDSCRCPSPPSRWGRTRRRRPSSPR